MLIFQTPVVVQQTFVQQLEGIVILVLGGIALPFVAWVIAKFKAQENHNAASTAKLNSIVAVTPGAAAHLAANPPAPPQS